MEVALKDAETLIITSGSVSALDRTHTALHGYLITLCDKNEISYEPKSSVTKLYKLLRTKTSALNNNIEIQSSEINKIIQTLSSILDALNQIRNNSSVAHPNENLLGEAEVTLAINAARTIFQYLDAKL